MLLRGPASWRSTRHAGAGSGGCERLLGSRADGGGVAPEGNRFGEVGLGEVVPYVVLAVSYAAGVMCPRG